MVRVRVSINFTVEVDTNDEDEAIEEVTEKLSDGKYDEDLISVSEVYVVR